MKTKFIFITGGVYSSLGKGITSSSIARVLKELGFSVTMQKLDPYLNVDPEFISPLQHGEIFITNDGAKSDLDLGNYERFIGHNLNKFCTVTSGVVYKEVIENERLGKYDGKTVQVIPHITNQIIKKIENLCAQENPDFAIVEIGGTVGDIESLPFIQAISEFSYKYGKENIMFAHCVPLIKVNSVFGELKTKPAQHSVKTLRSFSISPDLLLLRTEADIDQETVDKLSWSCCIDKKNIFVCKDLASTYFLPEELYKQKIQERILDYFKLKVLKDNFANWIEFTKKIRSVKDKALKIAIVGEYVDLHDAYFSVCAALNLASYDLNINLDIVWININDLNKSNINDIFKNVEAILLTPCDSVEAINNLGFLINFLSDKTIPTFGYGNVLYNIINFIGNDANIYQADKEVLGEQTTILDDELLKNLYNGNQLHERHHHKQEVTIHDLNPQWKIVGKRDNNIDVIKLLNHPFFYVVNFNPEFNAKPMKSSPLYLALLRKGMKNEL